MSNRSERNANYRKGKNDRGRGKSDPPGGGLNRVVSTIGGYLLAGLPGAALGLLAGDSPKEERRKNGNNRSYKRGNKKQ